MPGLPVVLRVLVVACVAATTALGAATSPGATPPPPDPFVTVHLTAGPLRFAYEGITIEGATFTSSSSPVAGAGPAVAHARLDAAPQGRVRIDTSESRFPGIGFRGVLEPASVILDRLPSDPATPTCVRYALRLNDLGAFHGEIAAPGAAGGAPRWQPIAGWADHAVLTLALTLPPSAGKEAAAAAPRSVESIALFGTDAAHPVELRQVTPAAAGGARTVAMPLGSADGPTLRTACLTLRWSDGVLTVAMGPSTTFAGSLHRTDAAAVH